ncbi:MAG: hypothetical protein AB7O47_07735 [Flavobacteriales bacterium]
MKNIFRYLVAVVLTAFGLLTLFLSSSVIFDWFGVRAKEGNYVLFVVWANFISSIFYLVSAYGFVQLKKWSTKLLAVSVVILIVAFLGLLLHIKGGGIYETKTVGAMIFRTVITIIFTTSSYLLITKNKINEN